MLVLKKHNVANGSNISLNKETTRLSHLEILCTQSTSVIDDTALGMKIGFVFPV